MLFSKGIPRFKTRKKDHHASGSEFYSMGSVFIKDALRNSCSSQNAVYVHIPFCTKLCSFCNMRRGLGKPDEHYVALVRKHIKAFGILSGRSIPVNAIYFGGGTPSTLSEDDLCRILDTLYETFDVTPDAEVSMETSLTELSPQMLERVMKHGINRISVGVQTFDDAGRAVMGRRGSGEFAQNRLSDYRRTGLKNINIDIIYGYPYENVDTFQRDIEIFEALDLAGFSYYSLMVMKGSPMEKLILQEVLSQKERAFRDMEFFAEALRLRDRYSYEQMEITKIVRPGRDLYQYIRNRIAGGWTIPFGAAAGGNIGGGMIMNPLDIGAYEKMLEAPEEQRLMCFHPLYYERKRALDPLQLGMIEARHLLEGGVLAHLQEDIALLVDDGYLKKDGDVYRLTDLGLFWGNSIRDELFGKLPVPTLVSKPDSPIRI